MGVYLNMIGNPRANLRMNLHPDENYAREINQLFSIGLVMLNDDGTPSRCPPASRFRPTTSPSSPHLRMCSPAGTGRELRQRRRVLAVLSARRRLH